MWGCHQLFSCTLPDVHTCSEIQPDVPTPNAGEQKIFNRKDLGRFADKKMQGSSEERILARVAMDLEQFPWERTLDGMPVLALIHSYTQFTPRGKLESLIHLQHFSVL